MKKYKLIKEYPGSPYLGTILYEQDDRYAWQEDDKKYNNYIYGKDIIENYPEFWQEIKIPKQTFTREEVIQLLKENLILYGIVYTPDLNYYEQLLKKYE